MSSRRLLEPMEIVVTMASGFIGTRFRVRHANQLFVRVSRAHRHSFVYPDLEKRSCQKLKEAVRLRKLALGATFRELVDPAPAR